jgi:predicted permease
LVSLEHFGRPALGRILTPSDDQRGCAGVAVLSYSLWRNEYGGRPDILGKTISLNGHPFDVVGISERGFSGFDVGSSVGVMVPVCAEQILRLHPEHILDTNSFPTASGIYGWLKVIGRLKPGISARQATARLKTLAPEIFQATLPRHWPAERQDLYLKRTFDTRSTANGQSDVREDYREALRILMAIGGIVLLVACVNVANLLLARSVSREKEIAIRIALGSGKGRLIRQLLTESLLLSSVGTVLGALFARWGVQLLVRFLDVFLDLTPDTRVLAFNAGVATVTGLLVGIAPALRGTRVQPQQAMKAGTRGHTYSSGRVSKFGLGNLLVMAQVTLAFLLVVTAGLLLSTFWKLSSVNPGFEPKHVLLMRVDFRNGNPARERRVWEMLERLRTIPGVKSASISSAKPLCNCDWTDEVVVDGYTPKSPKDTSVFADEVSDQYLKPWVPRS